MLSLYFILWSDLEGWRIFAQEKKMGMWSELAKYVYDQYE